MNTQATKALADIRGLIANDAYAITFQSLAQYRKALMSAIDLSTQPAAKPAKTGRELYYEQLSRAKDGRTIAWCELSDEDQKDWHAKAEEMAADERTRAEAGARVHHAAFGLGVQPSKADLDTWLAPLDELTTNDGWIEWSGGDCPVNADLQVRVKLRGNRGEPEQAAGTFSWRHGVDGYSDIIAYRIIKEQS